MNEGHLRPRPEVGFTLIHKTRLWDNGGKRTHEYSGIRLLKPNELGGEALEENLYLAKQWELL